MSRSRSRPGSVKRANRSAFLSLLSCSDINRQRIVGPLAFFDFLRQLAKVLRLFVAGLYLELCELSRFLTGQEQNQSFKFGCHLVRMVSLSEHQMFKFPNYLVVIHNFSLHESVARN